MVNRRESSQESLQGLSEIRLTHTYTKRCGGGHWGFHNLMTNGHILPGSKMAPKVFTIIYNTELGKPYVFLLIVRRY